MKPLLCLLFLLTLLPGCSQPAPTVPLIQPFALYEDPKPTIIAIAQNRENESVLTFSSDGHLRVWPKTNSAEDLMSRLSSFGLSRTIAPSTRQQFTKRDIVAATISPDTQLLAVAEINKQDPLEHLVEICVYRTADAHLLARQTLRPGESIARIEITSDSKHLIASKMYNHHLPRKETLLISGSPFILIELPSGNRLELPDEGDLVEGDLYMSPRSDAPIDFAIDHKHSRIITALPISSKGSNRTTIGPFATLDIASVSWHWLFKEFSDTESLSSINHLRTDDAASLLVRASNRDIVITDISTRKNQTRFSVPETWTISDLAISPNRQLLAVTFTRQGTGLYDVASGKLLALLNRGNEANHFTRYDAFSPTPVWPLHFTADSTALYTTDTDNRLVRWSLENLQTFEAASVK